MKRKAPDSDGDPVPKKKKAKAAPKPPKPPITVGRRTVMTETLKPGELLEQLSKGGVPQEETHDLDDSLLPNLSTVEEEMDIEMKFSPIKAPHSPIKSPAKPPAAPERVTSTPKRPVPPKRDYKLSKNPKRNAVLTAKRKVQFKDGSEGSQTKINRILTPKLHKPTTRSDKKRAESWEDLDPTPPAKPTAVPSQPPPPAAKLAENPAPTVDGNDSGDFSEGEFERLMYGTGVPAKDYVPPPALPFKPLSNPFCIALSKKWDMAHRGNTGRLTWVNEGGPCAGIPLSTGKDPTQGRSFYFVSVGVVTL